ncbi:MAG: hypothetical protein QGH42_13475 [Kiritimatiellia bacterium]|jgi:hypothetical protein|nr:hypothetical protein [Kiritimatiellia bacterium]MDP6810965.1 hypothetical protein [Kiritimatiellia bacterium]MDP7025236.1 hypothetical protein [Kiritimatiellia bacterium]
MIEILCTACGEDTLLKREPVYEGFTRAGEELSCASCGHVYASEAEVPFKEKRTVEVFTDDDRPDTVDIFDDDEKQRVCRYCKHYVVNPFAQRCDRHVRFVEATDYCDDFAKSL